MHISWSRHLLSTEVGGGSGNVGRAQLLLAEGERRVLQHLKNTSNTSLTHLETWLKQGMLYFLKPDVDKMEQYKGKKNDAGFF